MVPPRYEQRSSPIKLTEGEPIDDRYIAPKLAPERYPGTFPKAKNSLIIGDALHTMEFDLETGSFMVDTQQGPLPINELLNALGVPRIEERFPVTVFGSNRCPGQLLDKFEPSGITLPDPNLQVLPMATATLKGYDVVYNAKVGNMGYFFADLYQGPETKGTEIEVAVLFASAEQLAAIDNSETAYDYYLLGDVEVGRRPDESQQAAFMTIPAYAHVGKTEVYVRKAGEEMQPIAVGAIRARNRRLVALRQLHFQDYFFGIDPEGAKYRVLKEIVDVYDVFPTARVYRANMKMKRAGGKHNLKERIALQEALIAATDDSERKTVDPSRV